jgi:hypothetical protein
MGTPMVAPVGVDPDGLIASCGLGSAVADHADLAQATRALLAEAEYGELSRRCREHVLTHHDPRRLAEALRLHRRAGDAAVKVLMLIESLKMGGKERQALELLRGCARAVWMRRWWCNRARLNMRSRICKARCMWWRAARAGMWG